jgi:hypothetical protein
MSEILNEQARIYLSPKNQVDIEDHLDNKNVRYARVYFLGALDELLKQGGITSQQFNEILDTIHMSDHEASGIRHGTVH